MKKALLILSCLLLILNFTNGQNKVYFKNKKISELEVNMGEMYGVEGFSPTFPIIWKDFDPSGDNYLFSGYYSLNKDKSLNGEVKLTRLQIQIAEGTLNVKEELTFNFVNGEMNGPVIYSQYSSDNNGETTESELLNKKWKKDMSISANYSPSDGKYKNINFVRTNEWEKTKYIITQTNSYDISIDYFGTIIDINTSAASDRPIFKRIKY